MVPCGILRNMADFAIVKFYSMSHSAKRRLEIDKAVNDRLADLGWCVLRFWESDIKSDLTSALSIIGYHYNTRSA